MSSLHPAQIEAAEGAARILDIEFLNPPSLADLARTLGISPYQLGRAFHRHHGVTMPTYVRRLRIARACAVLREAGMLVAEAALATGYASQSAFVRAFQRETGKTPGEFRNASQSPSGAISFTQGPARGRAAEE
ncbi:helix-turn-helix transcriptional regulator [Roseimicrobium sp. ORNL1]|nr:helix-turn-helix transcriptional regulator [Roseimicrobium sp. ORNL1]